MGNLGCRLAVFLFSSLLAAQYASGDRMSDHIVHFENSPFKNADLYCDDDDELLPKDNDFKILEYALMSSEHGHRFAVITLENTSSGNRRMTSDHMSAILADCTRVQPLNFEYNFEGSEIITKEVGFGVHRFPIVKVITEK